MSDPTKFLRNIFFVWIDGRDALIDRREARLRQKLLLAHFLTLVIDPAQIVEVVRAELFLSLLKLGDRGRLVPTPGQGLPPVSEVGVRGSVPQRKGFFEFRVFHNVQPVARPVLPQRERHEELVHRNARTKRSFTFWIPLISSIVSRIVHLNRKGDIAGLFEAARKKGIQEKKNSVE